MTIEEKAKKEYPAVSSLDYPVTHDYNIAAKNGFIEGAEWMIDKAAEWFKNQKEEIGISWFEDYEIRFRKAMEE